MTLYRCDFRDGRGLVFSSHEIEALDDEDAIAKCRELCSHSRFVLRQGDRCIEAQVSVDEPLAPRQ